MCRSKMMKIYRMVVNPDGTVDVLKTLPIFAAAWIAGSYAAPHVNKRLDGIIEGIERRNERMSRAYLLLEEAEAREAEAAKVKALRKD